MKGKLKFKLMKPFRWEDSHYPLQADKNTLYHYNSDKIWEKWRTSVSLDLNWLYTENQFWPFSLLTFSLLMFAFVDFLLVNVRQLLSMQREMQYQHRFMFHSHENGHCTQQHKGLRGQCEATPSILGGGGWGVGGGGGEGIPRMWTDFAKTRYIHFKVPLTTAPFWLVRHNSRCSSANDWKYGGY